MLEAGKDSLLLLFCLANCKFNLVDTIFKNFLHQALALIG